jgi:hypothetical protein
MFENKKGDTIGVGEETFVWTFVWKFEGEGHLGKSRHRLENDIKVAGWTRTVMN